MDIIPTMIKKCIICNESSYENTLIKCSNTPNAYPTYNNPPFYIHFHCSFFFPCLSIGLSKDMNQNHPIIRNFRIKGLRELFMSGKANKCEKCEITEPAYMAKCFHE